MTNTEPAPVGRPGRASLRPAGSLRIGRIAGAEIYVTGSWFLIAGLLTLVMAEPLEAAQPGIGKWKYLGGFAFAVLLYLSVLLHEAAHAWAARHYGYPVRSITLHFLGGLTSIDGEARTPRQEFVIAVVGPLASIAAGLAALLVRQVTPPGVTTVAVDGLIGANLLVGVLNLVPGLPLDGGRLLKALVWAVSHNVHTGTTVAGWGGRVAALAALGWPLVMAKVTGAAPDVVDYLLALVIAAFLWSGATAAMASARLRRRLPSLIGRELARTTLAVPSDLPISEAVRRAELSEAAGLVTVTGDGHPIGVVSEAALLATPEERRPWVAVSAVAHTLEDGLSLPADIAGEDLIRAISRHPAAEYVLVEPDGSIVGVLSTGDVDRAFRAGR